eukprot:6180061-Pleurochrysis_carterae.AAC.1
MLHEDGIGRGSLMLSSCTAASSNVPTGPTDAQMCLGVRPPTTAWQKASSIAALPEISVACHTN